MRQIGSMSPRNMSLVSWRGLNQECKNEEALEEGEDDDDDTVSEYAEGRPSEGSSEREEEYQEVNIVHDIKKKASDNVAAGGFKYSREV